MPRMFTLSTVSMICVPRFCTKETFTDHDALRFNYVIGKSPGLRIFQAHVDESLYLSYCSTNKGATIWLCHLIQGNEQVIDEYVKKPWR